MAGASSGEREGQFPGVLTFALVGEPIRARTGDSEVLNDTLLAFVEFGGMGMPPYGKCINVDTSSMLQATPAVTLREVKFNIIWSFALKLRSTAASPPTFSAAVSPTPAPVSSVPARKAARAVPPAASGTVPSAGRARPTWPV